MSRKEYFAYGSNLNFEQMAYRCPEATAVGIAKLEGYELAFRRGFLTILPKEGASVEGLIWSVTDHDESQLDCYEGYPTFYDKETMTVTDADGAPHEIMVYTMNAPYRDQLLPVSSRYNAVVLQGCLDAGVSPQQFYDADEKYRNFDRVVALYGNLGKDQQRGFLSDVNIVGGGLLRSLSRTLAVQTREPPAAEYAVAVPSAKKPSRQQERG